METARPEDVKVSLDSDTEQPKTLNREELEEKIKESLEGIKSFGEELKEC